MCASSCLLSRSPDSYVQNTSDSVCHRMRCICDCSSPLVMYVWSLWQEQIPALFLRSPYPHCPVFLYRTLSCNDVSGRHGSWCCDSISDSVALGFRWRNILFAFCHIQRVGDIPVVRDTSVFCHLQVIVVEYEMHVIFVSPVAGEQATVEEGCGLILVKPRPYR